MGDKRPSRKRWDAFLCQRTVPKTRTILWGKVLNVPHKGGTGDFAFGKEVRKRQKNQKNVEKKIIIHLVVKWANVLIERLLDMLLN